MIIISRILTASSIVRFALGITGLIVFCCISSYNLSAQDCGSFSLNEAKKQYEIGNFEDVTEQLKKCLLTFSDIEKVQAYRLLAMTAIATDQKKNALDAIVALLTLNPTFEPNIFDPPQFIALVSELKDNFSTVKITSVSKKSEDVMLTPATVTVMSGDEIKRRGYMDLEAMLHDLSGFDISRANGLAYSNIYQRGYRSGANTDRTMFLIDGVEDNELWSNTVFLSRQYSVTNVKRVEIIYGPASTMYGANAFTGVINIITKDPIDYLTGDKKIAFTGQAGYGTFNTKFADVTASARYKNLSFSLTARTFQTDEKDLSGYSNWDYKPESEDFFKQVLGISGNDSKGGYNAQNYLNSNKFLDTASSLYTIDKDQTGNATKISLTDEGARRARTLDSLGLKKMVGGQPVHFSDFADDKLIYGKLKIDNWTIGFQWWNIDEGANPTYTDRYYSGSKNGTAWATRSTLLYANYTSDISENISLSSSTQYRVYGFFDDTRLTQFVNYSAGTLTLKNLFANDTSKWTVINFHQQSSQIRSELKGLFTFSSDLDLVSGFEFRNGTIQGDYNKCDTCDPSIDGLPPANVKGGNNYSNINLGFYAQSTYKPIKSLNLTGGARIDNNTIRGISNTVLNIRAAAVWSPDKFVFKAIYSTAFLEPTLFQKYATSGSRLVNNPFLIPEKVANIDVSASYSLKDITAEFAFYSAKYSDVVNTNVVIYKETGLPTTQFQSTGALAIMGFQAGATYRIDNYSIYANFTYTNPKDDISGARIGDIAVSSFNLGANAVFFDDLNISLRSNYVGSKETGKTTTVKGNPLSNIDSYFLLNGTVSYFNIFETGISLQLICNNILNIEYYDPGVRSADNLIYAPQIPQNERNLTLRMILDF
ncbi:MAG: TonB-dependent receptor [Bacteroidetes bacterium]|nr:TonB-dependent receptor [Bacteroidota bacterium]